MSLYDAYLEQIENRKEQGLKPKPIDDGGLVKELAASVTHVQSGQTVEVTGLGLPAVASADQSQFVEHCERVLGGMTINIAHDSGAFSAKFAEE